MTVTVSRVRMSPVVKKFIQIKKGEIESLQKAHEQAMAEISEAPQNKMSDPDATRGNGTEKASQVHEQIKEVEGSIQLLKSLPRGPFDRISLGCVFTLQSGKEKETYLMIPKDGGCSTVIQKRRVTCISIKAPVAEAVMDKGIGDQVTILGRTYTIVMVQ